MQVAVDRTFPYGRVIGIDIIPAQPPKGVSTIQGNFLSEAVREEVKNFLQDPSKGRLRQQRHLTVQGEEKALVMGEVEASVTNYVELEQRADQSSLHPSVANNAGSYTCRSGAEEGDGRLVDLVLSDMSAPWEQTSGFWKRSLSDPYFRMMNTSGMSFRDHAGSMV